MMPRIRRYSVISIALIMLLVAVAAMGLFLLQENASLELVEARLGTQLRATEMRLSHKEETVAELESQIAAELNLAEEVDLSRKEAILEDLRRRLGEALDAACPFPSEAEAHRVTDQIRWSARENNISILFWDSADTTMTLAARSYPAIRHSLDVEGTADEVIAFLQGLTHAPVPPAIQSMDITQVPARDGVWRMRLEMMVPHGVRKGNHGNMD